MTSDTAAESELNLLLEDLKDDGQPSPDSPMVRAPVNPQEYNLLVRNTLGLPKAKWDAVKMRSLDELGKLMAVKVTARVLLVTTFDCIEQLQVALAIGKDMLQRPKNEVSDENKLGIMRMMPLCATALKDLAAQSLVLAEKGVDQKATDDSKRPKNRPPQFRGVMVNVAPGSNVSVDGDKTVGNPKPAIAV